MYTLFPPKSSINLEELEELNNALESASKLHTFINCIYVPQVNSFDDYLAALKKTLPDYPTTLEGRHFFILNEDTYDIFLVENNDITFLDISIGYDNLEGHYDNSAYTESNDIYDILLSIENLMPNTEDSEYNELGNVDFESFEEMEKRFENLENAKDKNTSNISEDEKKEIESFLPSTSTLSFDEMNKMFDSDNATKQEPSITPFPKQPSNSLLEGMIKLGII